MTTLRKFACLFCFAILLLSGQIAHGQDSDDAAGGGEFRLGNERAQPSSDDTDKTEEKSEEADKDDTAAKQDDPADDSEKDDTDSAEGPDDSDAEESTENADASDKSEDSSGDNVDVSEDGAESDEESDVTEVDRDNSEEPSENESQSVADKEEDEKEKPAKKDLTIASWGGAYQDSQALAYFKPFSEETGIDISTAKHGGDLTALRLPHRDDAPDWDVVDMSRAQAEKACNAGLLELIKHEELEPAADGQTAKEDFFDEALQPCGVASMAWSSLIVFDERSFKKDKQPKTAEDFFNVKRFKGKRALQNGARYNLELALMADGVATKDVYATLQTDEGLERALTKLASIYQHIIWWDKPNEPLELLKKRKVSMATAYNGRSFFVIAGQSQPFGLIWDAQVYDMDLWAIPRAARNKKAARAFIAFATQSDRLASQTQWFPYGPMRKSSTENIGNHAEVGLPMARFVPTAAGNFDRALAFDGIWWSRQKERIDARFEAWKGEQVARLEALAKQKAKKKKRRKKRKYKKRRKYKKKKKF